MPKGDPAGYLPRVKQARKKGVKLTQSTPGGSYDGKPAEDDPRFNPKKQGNKRSGGYKPRARSNRPAFNQRNEQNV